MWKIFNKKRTEEDIYNEVYKVVLYCSNELWFISSDHFLTINKKRQKANNIYIGCCSYICNVYGQKYLDFFEEEMYKRGWIIGKINKEANEANEND